MNRTAGAAPPRSRSIVLATLALLALGALGFASSVALAGQASPFQATTGDATATITTTAAAPTTSPTTTGTVPDPNLPPPKPDPRPKKPRAAPPPPPAPAPEPAAPQSTTTATAPAVPTPPPPSSSLTQQTTTSAQPTPKRSRQRSTPRGRRFERVAPRASKAARDRTRLSSGEAEPALERTTADTPYSGAMVVFFSLFALGLLLVVAAGVPPARVPWLVVAQPLNLYRSDLAAIGLVAMIIALINIAVLL